MVDEAALHVANQANFMDGDHHQHEVEQENEVNQINKEVVSDAAQHNLQGLQVDNLMPPASMQLTMIPQTVPFNLEVPQPDVYPVNPSSPLLNMPIQQILPPLDAPQTDMEVDWPQFLSLVMVRRCARNNRMEARPEGSGSFYTPIIFSSHNKSLNKKISCCMG